MFEPPTKIRAQSRTSQFKKEFSQIEIDIAAGAKTKALNRLQTLVEKYPETDLADDAHIKMADIYYESGNYSQAYNSYMSVVNSQFFSPREVDALLGAAKSLTKLGRYDEALSVTHQGLDFKNIGLDLRLDLHLLQYTITNQLGDRIDSLKSMVFIAENAPAEKTRQSFRIRASDFVSSQLNDDELKVVANDSYFKTVQPYAIYKVGLTLFEQRDYRGARNYFETLVEISPESDLGRRAGELIAQIEARRKVEPRTIGAILPLSGRHANVGYRTLKGLQLGLGVYGRERSDFKLAVIDSESNPDIARRAVERLVTEDHVIAIVGSLLTKTSVAVAAKCDELGVPNIALSQKSGLTDVGEYIFRNALTSQAQVRELVSSAMNQHNIKKFAVLYPNDSYGVEYTNLFWQEVLSRGGQITAAQSYPPKETDFRTYIERMVGTFYIEERADEYRLLYSDWVEKLGPGYLSRFQKSGRMSQRMEPPEELLAPIIDFDALFVPDGTKAVGQIAAMLKVLEVNNVKLLGTNLWNSPSLVKRGQSLVEGALFVDGLLDSDKEFRQSRFFTSFQANFGSAPGIFEVQAYDAGLILRQLIAGGVTTRSDLRENLMNLQKFSGSLGSINAQSNRELDRPLFALTVKEGQITRSTDPAQSK